MGFDEVDKVLSELKETGVDLNSVEMIILNGKIYSRDFLNERNI